MICGTRIWTLAVALTIGMGLYGCASLPPSSRTAAVHDVKIEGRSPQIIFWSSREMKSDGSTCGNKKRK